MKRQTTNKDVLFCIIAIIWIICNILIYALYDVSYVSLSNLFFIITLCILIIVKNRCDNFNKWLNKLFMK